MQSITVNTKERLVAVDITGDVERLVRKSGMPEGLCYLYVPHTTAGIFINERDDPAVALDIMKTLDTMVPRAGKYQHAEGNADSHIKSVLVGSSVNLPITGGVDEPGALAGNLFCRIRRPTDSHRPRDPSQDLKQL